MALFRGQRRRAISLSRFAWSIRNLAIGRKPSDEWRCFEEFGVSLTGTCAPVRDASANDARSAAWQNLSGCDRRASRRIRSG